jgi:alpha-L-fucosidase
MNLSVDSMMNRRRFFSTLIGTTAAFQSYGRSDASSRLGGVPKLALPAAEQTALQDLEVGMFVHFAPNTWQNRESDNHSTPLSSINPGINTDQWAECAVRLSAKYIIFVAKHAGGFCMWQTRSTNYGIRNTPWKGGHGDVMASLAASSRDRALKLGVYLSPGDRNFVAGVAGRCKTPRTQAAYNSICREQLTELLTRPAGRLS